MTKHSLWILDILDPNGTPQYVRCLLDASVLKETEGSHNVEVQSCNTALNRKWRGATVCITSASCFFFFFYKWKHVALLWRIIHLFFFQGIIYMQLYLYKILMLHLVLHSFYNIGKYKTIIVYKWNLLFCSAFGRRQSHWQLQEYFQDL